MQKMFEYAKSTDLLIRKSFRFLKASVFSDLAPAPAAVPAAAPVTAAVPAAAPAQGTRGPGTGTRGQGHKQRRRRGPRSPRVTMVSHDCHETTARV